MNNNLSNEINDAIEQSERDGGIWIKDLKDGDTVWVRTQNSVYRLRKIDGKLLMEGHPRFCPLPIEVRIMGSTWGGSMIKSDFIGVGMYMDLGTVTTSRIKSVEKQ